MFVIITDVISHRFLSRSKPVTKKRKKKFTPSSTGVEYFEIVVVPVSELVCFDGMDCLENQFGGYTF